MLMILNNMNKETVIVYAIICVVCAVWGIGMWIEEKKEQKRYKKQAKVNEKRRKLEEQQYLLQEERERRYWKPDRSRMFVPADWKEDKNNE